MACPVSNQKSYAWGIYLLIIKALYCMPHICPITVVTKILFFCKRYKTQTTVMLEPR